MRIVFLISICFLNSLLCNAQLWQSLNGGANGWVKSLFADTVNNILYVGGNIESAGGLQAKRIAQWNGFSWDTLSSGITSGIFCNYCCDVLTITKYNGKIYAGGSCTIAGNINAKYIASWDGTKWDSVGSGMDSPVLAMTVYNNELYVCGGFITAGGIYANKIAKWNGTQWSTVANDTAWGNQVLNNIIFYNGVLYVSGNFTNASTGIKRIAKWDGVYWRPLGNGIFLGGINDLAVYNNELYVAGGFSKASGNAGENIQKWDGSNWSDVGGGTDGAINDLFVHDNKLYAVGLFTTAGGVPANNIAVWDGTQWCGLGSNFDNVVLSIAFYKDTLYIGGGFRTINADTLNHIARWTGGSFVDTCGNTSGVSESTIYDLQFTIYPNPAHNRLTIEVMGDKGQMTNDKYTATIKSIFGQTLLEKTFTSKTTFNVSNWASGMLFVELRNEKGMIVRIEKVLVE